MEKFGDLDPADVHQALRVKRLMRLRLLSGSLPDKGLLCRKNEKEEEGDTKIFREDEKKG